MVSIRPRSERGNLPQVQHPRHVSILRQLPSVLKVRLPMPYHEPAGPKILVGN
jgi:hypothetical protein